MMNKKFFLTILLGLFLISFASASTIHNNVVDHNDVTYKERISTTYHHPYSSSVTTRTLTAYYDNDDRYSTHDYRHGYSYRTTKDYWNKHHDYDGRKSKSHSYYSRDHYRYKNYDYDYEHRHLKNQQKYYKHRHVYDYDDYEYDKKRLSYKHYNKKYYSKRYDDYYDYKYYDYYDDDYYDYRYYDYYDHKPTKKVRYIPYLDHREEVECYTHPPKHKLFYIEC